MKKSFDIKAFIFTISIIIVLVCGAVYAIRFLELKKKHDIETELEVAKAIIISKHSYKGKGISVQYRVDDKQYSLRTGVSSEIYNNYEVGSEIQILYKRSEPEKAIIDE